ncbi:hypothetical protein BN7_939 [Wickerhamomyces ciferrii]|uniref:F-box domain-containing protein n=1 Tax=Wickerhamomyces ciferrii (strain ATCC 14091 / BCRC 22168 / CBS 111 / JCM 3599 / NBRC 0793 / NRRL Y-1031 F-60-10) TaxID=1206466 RepID=K0KJW0_WICCF|nr:uncharacterized protein BN7_939 [Wickerhamomyces ciferrii]CCH41398.1 hypothetical protein BN7_939 [Wickerhamomyces ciferrii]
MSNTFAHFKTDFNLIYNKLISQYDNSIKLDDLPREILYEIARYVSPYNLMLTNKHLCDMFVPYYYQNIHIFLVLSKTLKVRNVAITFWDFGYNNILDTYRDKKTTIKDRILNCANFDYEALDTDVNFDRLNKGNNLSEYHNDSLDFMPKSIYRYGQIQHILQNTIANPHSKFKKYIKKLYVDISIFDGFPHLISNEESPVYKKLKSLKKIHKKNIFMLHLNPKEIETETEREVTHEIFERPNQVGIQSIAINSYAKEFVLLGVLYNFHYNHRRKNFMKLRTIEKVKQFNAYECWEDKMESIKQDQIDSEKSKELITREVFSAKAAIIFRKRTFISKNIVTELLNDLLDVIGSSQNFDCSYTINGILSNSFIKSERGPEFFGEDFFKLKPTFIVINKPKTN